jgi:hypothetical protein
MLIRVRLSGHPSRLAALAPQDEGAGGEAGLGPAIHDFLVANNLDAARSRQRTIERRLAGCACAVPA